VRRGSHAERPALTRRSVPARPCPQSRSYAQAGKSLVFSPVVAGPGCRRRAAAATLPHTVDEALAKKRRIQHNTGADEVNPISFLPHAFTTLFIIAASLLLGLTR